MAFANYFLQGAQAGAQLGLNYNADQRAEKAQEQEMRLADAQDKRAQTEFDFRMGEAKRVQQDAIDKQNVDAVSGIIDQYGGDIEAARQSPQYGITMAKMMYSDPEMKARIDANPGYTPSAFVRGNDGNYTLAMRDGDGNFHSLTEQRGGGGAPVKFTQQQIDGYFAAVAGRVGAANPMAIQGLLAQMPGTDMQQIGQAAQYAMTPQNIPVGSQLHNVAAVRQEISQRTPLNNGKQAAKQVVAAQKPDVKPVAQPQAVANNVAAADSAAKLPAWKPEINPTYGQVLPEYKGAPVGAAAGDAYVAADGRTAIVNGGKYTLYTMPDGKRMFAEDGNTGYTLGEQDVLKQAAATGGVIRDSQPAAKTGGFKFYQQQPADQTMAEKIWGKSSLAADANTANSGQPLSKVVASSPTSGAAVDATPTTPMELAKQFADAQRAQGNTLTQNQVMQVALAKDMGEANRAKDAILANAQRTDVARSRLAGAADWVLNAQNVTPNQEKANSVGDLMRQGMSNAGARSAEEANYVGDFMRQGMGNAAAAAVAAQPVPARAAKNLDSTFGASVTPEQKNAAAAAAAAQPVPDGTPVHERPKYTRRVPASVSEEQAQKIAESIGADIRTQTPQQRVTTGYAAVSAFHPQGGKLNARQRYAAIQLGKMGYLDGKTVANLLQSGRYSFDDVHAAAAATSAAASMLNAQTNAQMRMDEIKFKYASLMQTRGKEYADLFLKEQERDIKRVDGMVNSSSQAGAAMVANNQFLSQSLGIYNSKDKTVDFATAQKVYGGLLSNMAQDDELRARAMGLPTGQTIPYEQLTQQGIDNLQAMATAYLNSPDVMQKQKEGGILPWNKTTMPTSVATAGAIKLFMSDPKNANMVAGIKFGFDNTTGKPNRSPAGSSSQNGQWVNGESDSANSDY